MEGCGRFLAVFAVAFVLIGGTASAAPSKFYDAILNGGISCPQGVNGTEGGSFGNARVKVGTSTSTVTIRVRGLSPDTAYDVTFSTACTFQTIGTLTTNERGSGSGTFTFATNPSGFFRLSASGSLFATQQTTF